VKESEKRGVIDTYAMMNALFRLATDEGDGASALNSVISRSIQLTYQFNRELR
jgi:hypothetical protein